MTTCEASGWYAVFTVSGEKKVLPVAYFEVEVDSRNADMVRRRAIIYHPTKRLLVDCIALRQFEKLIYEPDPHYQRDRKVNYEKLLEWLAGRGQISRPKHELAGAIDDQIYKSLGSMKAREEMEEFYVKDELGDDE